MPAKPLETKAVETLVGTLCSVDDPTCMLDLLEDLCTPRELIEMAQRLEVARLLLAGKQYLVIQEETGASATTIARVSKALNYGQGGYRQVLSEEDES